MESVTLEPRIYPRLGFDAWAPDGSFKFRTLNMGRIFHRRAAYFRVNTTGKVYRVYSRWKTVEVRAAFSEVERGARVPVEEPRLPKIAS